MSEQSHGDPVAVKYRFGASAQIEVKAVKVDIDTFVVERGKGVSAPSVGHCTIEHDGAERFVAGVESDDEAFTIKLTPIEAKSAAVKEETPA